MRLIGSNVRWIYIRMRRLWSWMTTWLWKASSGRGRPSKGGLKVLVKIKLLHIRNGILWLCLVTLTSWLEHHITPQNGILGTATNFNLKLVFPHNTSSTPPSVPSRYESSSFPRLARKSFTLFLKSVTVPSIIFVYCMISNSEVVVKRRNK